jgi:hypothetical protein
MKNSMLGTLVAVGLFGAMNVRAETATETAAASAPAQQQDVAPAYGLYVNGPVTVDADGVPVARPNPMHDFLERDREFNRMPIEAPLESDQRPDPVTGQNG